MGICDSLRYGLGLTCSFPNSTNEHVADSDLAAIKIDGEQIRQFGIQIICEFFVRHIIPISNCKFSILSDEILQNYLFSSFF